MLKIWVFYFIEKISLPPIFIKIITLKNFTFFTIEDFVKQLQAGLLASGSFYWSLLPGKPFKRLFQWRCDVRPRLQRRVRSSPQNPVLRHGFPFYFCNNEKSPVIEHSNSK